MSISVLALPDPDAEALGSVATAREAVAGGAGVAAGSLSDEGLGEVIAALAGLESQVQAWRLQLAADAERREVESSTADSGTDAWLARLTGERREVMRGGLELARLLQGRYCATLAALGAGSIRLAQARAIVDGLEPTADDVDATLREQAEGLLLAKATGEGVRSGVPMPASRLRQAARRVYARLDGDVHARHQRESVRRAEGRARTDTWLVMGEKGDGTTVGRFSIPERHGAWLRSVLEGLTSPRRLVRDRAGTSQVDESAEQLGYYDWMGLALCELIEHLPTDRLPRAATTLLVRCDLDTLRGDLDAAGVATTDNGVDLSAGEVRRLACEAGLVPAVLGTGSAPLDLGRTARLHSDKQRQALALVFDSCAIAGCDRPFAWTEIHHLTGWAEGGTTDLDNAIPVCWHHHRAVEDPRFELRRHSATEWTLHRTPRPPSPPRPHVTMLPPRRE